MGTRLASIADVWILLLCLLTCAQYVRPNALLTPSHRGTMWARNHHEQTDYNYMEVKCGGLGGLKRNYGECGLCGDPYDRPRRHEHGGKYSTGAIAKVYEHGENTMKVRILLNSDEGGYFLFYLCEANDRPETLECFDRNFLMITEGRFQGDEYSYSVQRAGIVHLTLEIPEGLACDHCVLQWTYVTANTWGRDTDGTACVGCGIQPMYINCADIAIRGWGNFTRAPPTTTTTPPPPPPTTRPPTPKAPPRATTWRRPSATEDEGTRNGGNGNGWRNPIPNPPKSRPYTKPSAVVLAVAPAIPPPDNTIKPTKPSLLFHTNSVFSKPVPVGPNLIPPPPSPSPAGADNNRKSKANNGIKPDNVNGNGHGDGNGNNNGNGNKQGSNNGHKEDLGNTNQIDTGNGQFVDNGRIREVEANRNQQGTGKAKVAKPPPVVAANNVNTPPPIPLPSNSNTAQAGQTRGYHKVYDLGIGPVLPHGGQRNKKPVSSKSAVAQSQAKANNNAVKAEVEAVISKPNTSNSLQNAMPQEKNLNRKTYNLMNEYGMASNYRPTFETKAPSIASEYGGFHGSNTKANMGNRDSQRAAGTNWNNRGTPRLPASAWNNTASAIKRPRLNLAPFDLPDLSITKSASADSPNSRYAKRPDRPLSNTNLPAVPYAPSADLYADTAEVPVKRERYGEFLSPLNKRFYMANSYSNAQAEQGIAQTMQTQEPPQSHTPPVLDEMLPSERMRQNQQNSHKNRINSPKFFKPVITERFTNFEIGKGTRNVIGTSEYKQNRLSGHNYAINTNMAKGKMVKQASGHIDWLDNTYQKPQPSKNQNTQLLTNVAEYGDIYQSPSAPDPNQSQLYSHTDVASNQQSPVSEILQGGRTAFETGGTVAKDTQEIIPSILNLSHGVPERAQGKQVNVQSAGYGKQHALVPGQHSYFGTQNTNSQPTFQNGKQNAQKEIQIKQGDHVYIHTTLSNVGLLLNGHDKNVLLSKNNAPSQTGNSQAQKTDVSGQRKLAHSETGQRMFPNVKLSFTESPQHFPNNKNSFQNRQQVMAKMQEYLLNNQRKTSQMSGASIQNSPTNSQKQKPSQNRQHSFQNTVKNLMNKQDAYGKNQNTLHTANQTSNHYGVLSGNVYNKAAKLNKGTQSGVQNDSFGNRHNSYRHSNVREQQLYQNTVAHRINEAPPTRSPDLASLYNVKQPPINKNIASPNLNTQSVKKTTTSNVLNKFVTTIPIGLIPKQGLTSGTPGVGVGGWAARGYTLQAKQTSPAYLLLINQLNKRQTSKSPISPKVLNAPNFKFQPTTAAPTKAADTGLMYAKRKIENIAKTTPPTVQQATTQSYIMKLRKRMLAKVRLANQRLADKRAQASSAIDVSAAKGVRQSSFKNEVVKPESKGNSFEPWKVTAKQSNTHQQDNVAKSWNSKTKTAFNNKHASNVGQKRSNAKQSQGDTTAAAREGTAPTVFVKSTVQSFLERLTKKMEEQIRLNRATGKVKNMPQSKDAIFTVLRKMAMNALVQNQTNSGSSAYVTKQPAQKVAHSEPALREVTVEKFKRAQIIESPPSGNRVNTEMYSQGVDSGSKARVRDKSPPHNIDVNGAQFPFKRTAPPTNDRRTNFPAYRLGRLAMQGGSDVMIRGGNHQRSQINTHSNNNPQPPLYNDYGWNYGNMAYGF